MLDTSDLGADLAEELAREGYVDEARETWNTAKEVAETAADVGTDLIPGVSFVKDSTIIITIIITSINPVTGEPVETWERVFAGVTLLIPSVFTKPAKWAFKGIAKV